MAAAALAAAGVVAAAVLLARSGLGSPAPFAASDPPPGLAERFHPPENWAWGLIQAGDGPVQRYGVAAPDAVAKADVLILPGYGETAETWFETARELTGAGDAVWVLEGAGQGGSARLTGQRDLGEVRSFDGDVAAVKAMIQTVIRPQPRRPLVVLGEGVGALVAARAAESWAVAGGLVLSQPDCRPRGPAGLLVRLGLGGVRAPDGEGWRRDGPDDFARGRTHDPWRGAVTRAWQLANPDLRMGGPSLDWLAAFDAMQRRAGADAKLIATPTLQVESVGAVRCLDVVGAQTVEIAGAGPALELEDDAHRRPWLAALTRFVADLARRADPHPGGAAAQPDLFKPPARR
jgi:lysophospholipase